MARPLVVRISTVDSRAAVIVTHWHVGGWPAVGQAPDRCGSRLYAVCAPTSGTGRDVPFANRMSPWPVVSGRGDVVRIQPLPKEALRSPFGVHAGSTVSS